MPNSLVRYQQTGNLHFVTFSCYRRQPHLKHPDAKTSSSTHSKPWGEWPIAQSSRERRCLIACPERAKGKSNASRRDMEHEATLGFAATQLFHHKSAGNSPSNCYAESKDIQKAAPFRAAFLAFKHLNRELSVAHHPIEP